MAELKSLTAAESGGIVINRVLRNTYLLLGMTLAFSSVITMAAVATNAPYLGFFPTLIGFFGLLFLVHRWRTASVTGSVSHGFPRLHPRPLLSLYLSLPNGPALVGLALAMTAGAFVGLSMYALVTRKDFSFLSGFLVAGFFVVLGAILLNYFTDIGGLSLMISAAVVLLASALILFETSNVIHGGETNYIRATVGLYVSIYNLFTSLLHLLGVFSED
jgi:modulator of FtsH protease